MRRKQKQHDNNNKKNRTIQNLLRQDVVWSSEQPVFGLIMPSWVPVVRKKHCAKVIPVVLLVVLIGIYSSSVRSSSTVVSTSTRKEVNALDELEKELFSNPPKARISSYGIHEKLVRGTGHYRLSQPRGQLQVMNSKVQAPLSWSQYGQDILIDNFFNGKRNGFFVEIGGYDGETNSNTLLLEKRRGWDGLLVEANPYIYKVMVQRDRKCRMINCCISNYSPEMMFYLADALTSSNDAMSEEHLERVEKEQNKSLSGTHYGETVAVQCFSLMDIMNVIGRRHIDYFSLDVEGGELFILKSIDWEKLDIEYFTVETDQHREEILHFMENKGYDHVKNILGDDIFRKRRQ